MIDFLSSFYYSSLATEMTYMYISPRVFREKKYTQVLSDLSNVKRVNMPPGF